MTSDEESKARRTAKAETQLPSAGGSARPSLEVPGLAIQAELSDPHVGESSGGSEIDGARKKRPYTRRMVKTPTVEVQVATPPATDLARRLATLEAELAELRHQRSPPHPALPQRSQRGTVVDGVYQGARQEGSAPSTPRSNERRIEHPKVFESLKRWGINFSGKRSEDVFEFVSQVDDAMEAFPHIQDADILAALRGLISGCAREWYRQRRFLTWAEARKEFLARFSDPDYQLALQDEILGRTQGEKEAMSEYLAKMRSLFGRMAEPWTESRQVRCCHRNMLPRYRVNIALRDDTTFEELEAEAIRKENAYVGSHRWRPPPRAEESLCPSLAYTESAGAPKERRSYLRCLDEDLPQQPSQEADSDEAKWETEVLNLLRSRRPGNRPKREFPAGDKPASTGNGERVCWNCFQRGHFHNECPVAEKRVFCYRCGYPEVTSPNCPRCNAGNGQ